MHDMYISYNTYRRVHIYNFDVCSIISKIVCIPPKGLSKLVFSSPEAMVTIDVHNRDVVGSLRDAKISSPKDFDWMAQLRYYWAPTGSIIMYETQKPGTRSKP